VVLLHEWHFSNYSQHSVHFNIVPCSRQNFQSHFHQQQTCPIADYPIKYWGKIGEEFYDKLAATAKPYLSITTTLGASELPFSKLEFILTERRNRLSGEGLSRLNFLSSVGEE
jgi:hypothetical protein